MKCLELISAAEGNFQKSFLQIVWKYYFILVLVHCGICYKGTSKSRIRIVYSSKSPPWKVPTVKWTMELSISKILQDINGGFLQLLGALMKHFLEGSAPLLFLVNQLRGEDLYYSLFSFGLIYQCLNGVIPSRKCAIKALTY